MMSTAKKDQTLCRRLRSKEMFFTVEPDPAIPDTRSGHFWCTHTMNCLGPDGKPVEEERCQTSRTCFEHY